MNKPEIIAIAALGKQTRYICNGYNLLWTIPEDLQRVKKITTGYPLIMGRKTYQSIGRPLPHRTNIVITRNLNYKDDAHPECVVVHSLDEAIEKAKNSPGGNEKIFIFGGAEIYEIAMSITDKLLLTLVDSLKEGTAKFPEYLDRYTETSRTIGGSFENDIYEWVDYIKK